jgi:hypothetical protein
MVPHREGVPSLLTSHSHNRIRDQRLHSGEKTGDKRKPANRDGISCLGRGRGGGGAEAADVEPPDVAGEGCLRLHNALQLHDGPLRARRIGAPATHADLHLRRFSATRLCFPRDRAGTNENVGGKETRDLSVRCRLAAGAKLLLCFPAFPLRCFV